jgi:tRNA (guanine-N7-)-methyltransferase
VTFPICLSPLSCLCLSVSVFLSLFVSSIYCIYLSLSPSQYLLSQYLLSPLSTSLRHQLPIQLNENWLHEAYGTLSRPFLLDIGCAEGKWAINYNRISSKYHILGLDIREKIIEIAKFNQQFAEETLSPLSPLSAVSSSSSSSSSFSPASSSELHTGRQSQKNLHFLTTNANVNLGKVLSEINKGPSSVEMITIQFPDPCFKVKHQKRRLVTKEFVQTILRHSKNSNLNIFIQSDHLHLMSDVLSIFDDVAKDVLMPASNYSSRLEELWKNPNPFEVPTERERIYLAKGLPIYRMLYVRCPN